MELIELDATAQRALELLTNAGMSDGSIYDYTHTGFGSILRHFTQKAYYMLQQKCSIIFAGATRAFGPRRYLTMEWGLVRRSCELLKQCAAMNSIDLPDLQPWDPVWNRPKQIIQHDAPTAKQFAESENIYVLVWMVNKRMEQLGLSENTVRHYTEEGLAVILKSTMILVQKVTQTNLYPSLQRSEDCNMSKGRLAELLIRICAKRRRCSRSSA